MQIKSQVLFNPSDVFKKYKFYNPSSNQPF
jgi:hypothetical protein